MPNIITHTLFAEEVQKLLDNENLKNRRQLFAVGLSVFSQGDPCLLLEENTSAQNGGQTAFRPRQ